MLFFGDAMPLDICQHIGPDGLHCLRIGIFRE